MIMTPNQTTPNQTIRNQNQLIYAGAVITMNDHSEIFAPGYLRIAQDKIIEIGAGRPAPTEAETVQDFGDDVLLPGFVNTHHHIASSLLQGIEPKHKMAVGTTRDGSWLKLSIAFDQAQCLAGAALGYAQLLASGITTTTDSQSSWRGLRKLDGSITAAINSGLRVIFTAAFSNKTELVPAQYQLSVSESVAELARLRSDYQSQHVIIEPEPLSLPRVTDELILALHQERNHLMAMHSTYSAEFDAWARKEYGYPAIEHLARLGVLDEKLLLAHPVHYDDAEIKLIASAATKTSYCVVSNQHMGLAVPDLSRLHTAGIPVGLGLDHPNGSHDFFETMKTTMLTQRSLKLDQDACSAQRVLEMATIDGANALGMADQIGSLEIGKQADLIVIDRTQPQLQPLGGLIEQLVTGAKANHVKHVAIAGSWQLWDFQPANMNLAEIIAEANLQQQYLLKIAGLSA